ncbi:MAG TPA: amidohydrolase family protein [Dongiaceae bacterium]|nr:amidohydrolase family protein [Dongiaceae bacterium]
MPAGTIDTHFHVFGPDAKYPYAPDRTYTPPEASLAAYEHLADMIGISRAVIVQPSVYGTDNSRILAAMQESRIPMRAVAVIDPSTPDSELEALRAQGVCGARINLVFNRAESFKIAGKLADMVRDLGWHLQFLADVSQIPDLARSVAALRLPVVFDHLGHVPAGHGVGDPGFQDLLALLRDGITWVKLSGAYRATARTHPPYDDIAPFAQALIAANPTRVLWGSDWPHPSIPVPMPNDGDLVDMTMGWVADSALRHRLFIANAEKLYGFEPVAERSGY